MTTETTAKAKALHNAAATLQDRAHDLVRCAYSLEAEAADAEGDRDTAEWLRSLARGDGERGYIVLRAKQFLARGTYYEGDGPDVRALVDAEVVRMKAEAANAPRP